MKLKILLIVLFAVTKCDASLNCTSHHEPDLDGFGCIIGNLTDENEIAEIQFLYNENHKATQEDIEWIAITGSEFETLSSENFEKFDKVVTLIVIQCSGFKNLDKFTFLKRFTSIEIDQTNLEIIANENFRGLANLQNLFLTSNKIQTIQENSFEDLGELKKIKLNDNKIESLSENIFSRNKKLVEIDLNNNQLKVISAKLFSENLKLQTLLLGDNSITEIEQDFHQNLKYLRKVDFDNNKCIDEKFKVELFSQWSAESYKFKECNVNFAIEVLQSKLTKIIDENEISKVEAKFFTLFGILFTFTCLIAVANFIMGFQLFRNSTPKVFMIW